MEMFWIWMDTVEMAPRLHFSVADFRFCSWLTLFCFSSAKSPCPEDSGLLLLNTMLFFACSAPRCTLAGFTLALVFLWFLNFCLDFSLCLIFGIFLFVGKSRCILGRIKSEANYSLVWSWAVPKGVTFCMPSQGGRARSPFSTIPCIFWG